jgi:hypothetical protein
MMIDTDPTVTISAAAHHVRCEAMLQCVDECCPPVQCTRPATTRVTFPCSTPDCARASHVMVLCGRCADAEPDTTRRPL